MILSCREKTHTRLIYSVGNTKENPVILFLTEGQLCRMGHVFLGQPPPLPDYRSVLNLVQLSINISGIKKIQCNKLSQS